MTAKHEITHDDILPMEVFARERRDRRRALADIKRDRRLALGPSATLYFENYDTMWWQVHEMLLVEGGGEAQLADELAAYNPLIPKGQELVATLMFEIDDPVRRDALLDRLGGVEHGLRLTVDGETIVAVPEGDVERTTEDGRASAVHFLHFPFTPNQIARFRAADARVVVAIEHPAYGHMTVMPDAVRQALARDFD